MKKVFDEQMEVFDGDLECDVTQEHLSKMKYLDCCIKEALRLYPSVPIIARKVQKDTIIDDTITLDNTICKIRPHKMWIGWNNGREQKDTTNTFRSGSLV